MNKKNLCKKAIGICLVVMMAMAGVGKYAKAQEISFTVIGKDKGFYEIVGGTEMNKTRGTSYTAESGSDKCHCSVSATFRWYGGSGELLYSNGNGAGGMHGASVSIYYSNKETQLSCGFANHTGEAIVGGSERGTSSEKWPK